ncbi:leucine-rich repeat domain-containing protein [Fodinibius saliphilus]|uniref:leucine-rich repeat domain-containing protein n=1 Tax=Fodinibius saliphilus TaxID=1920650 RepID=UPI001107CD35|nr:hypothetical protein [Fodinibius saliphilus]
MKLQIGVLLVLLMSLSAIVFGQNKSGVTGDRQALMDLYNATDGDNWVDNSGWGSGDPSDSWYGVQVDANGRVVRLDLWDNGLQGSLPASIGNLTKVKYLNLKKNQLTGDIPSELGNMVSLEWLLLEGKTKDNDSTGPKEPPQDLTKPYHQGKRNESTNHFTSLPSTIGNLQNLTRFELSGSGISQIPSEVYDITSLEGLYMSHNYNVTHGIDSKVGNLRNLRHFYMAENNMTGDLPSSMSNLTKLTYFTIGSSSQTSNQNSFTGTLPDFSNATGLRQFVLSKNELGGDWPKYWNNGNFTQLITLSGQWNNFTGTLHGFNNLPSIRSIVLNGNNLSGSLDPQLTQIDQGVKIVALGWNNFSGDIPQDGYGWYYDMRNWRLNDNDLTGRIPCDLWNMLNKSDNLRRVYMNNNRFSSNATSCMKEVSSPVLQTISISGNNF